MLINEVKEQTGLTKKAIEYYTEKGLITPAILENGYRDYSQEDVELLKKIAILRKLDISTEEIKEILSDNSNTALQKAAVRKELNLQREQVKREILNKLSTGKSYDEIQLQLEALEQSKTITEKLLEAFPGYYGRYICLHFAAFLNEPIKTESQRQAYETLLSFLDNMEMVSFPEEVQEYLNENTRHIGVEQMAEIIESVHKAMENPDKFLADKKEIIDQYLEYKQSEEYINSPAYKMMKVMEEFNQASGYYDVFIPALKELSSSYAEYRKQMEAANEKLLEKYPEMGK